MVMSVVVGFLYMSIVKFEWLRVTDKSKKLIVL
jgi:hypothetical protein